MYCETSNSDPAELVDRGRFPTSEAISDHLISHLIPALIEANKTSPFKEKNAWRPDKVVKYLAFLAHHLSVSASDSGIGTRDIAWWQLHKALGGPKRKDDFPFSSVILAIVTVAYFHPPFGFVQAFITGIVSGAFCRMMARSRHRPASASLRLRGRIADLLRQLLLGFPEGLLFASAPIFMARFGFGWRTAVAFGVIAGPGLGIASGIARWAATPQASERPQTPAESLDSDLSLTLIQGVGFGLAIELAGVFTFSRYAGLGLCPGLIVGFARVHHFRLPSLSIGRVGAGETYLTTVLILSRKGKVPRNLMAFLMDMHSLGLLRQVGSVYQFRHAKLQDWLVAEYERQELSFMEERGPRRFWILSHWINRKKALLRGRFGGGASGTA